ncbi:uncharacterized protein LOC125236081 [Leguminivora glycinivorella]|uniref:uncharacterized protein LOC125236081 n=1 Tax=Leguminivora glycinivorella TaxID=1035111 RepID=UPI00200F56AF|nr:uncharacterized protein LOC125236081 [Leguminivora glycinivorella]
MYGDELLQTHNTWPHDKYFTRLECSKKVAEILGISERTVRSIFAEHNSATEFASPKKPGPKLSVIDKLDEFTFAAIRRTVHQFFHRNEPPTIEKVLQVVNDDPGLPNLSFFTLRQVLKHLNFKYASRKRQSSLIDRADIILWRKRYLVKIKQYCREGRPIYYQDETWINEGHTVNKVWQDPKVLSSRQAFLEGLTTGLKAPSGKGRRLIISHIGSEEGFVENGLLLFESKKNTQDYHKEMNAQHFEEWLTGILPRLKPNSVLVLDNAPYHSRKLESGPVKKWNKGQIIQWLHERNVPCDMSMIKTELWALVETQPKVNKMAVDELAAAHNVTILRLPPYHCELNPIELVWAQVKGHVAKKNKSFKMAEVKTLLMKVWSL